MRATCHLLKAPGAALWKDFAHARFITLSRPGALNTMTLPMVRDLHRAYVTEPHPDPNAVYVLRGEGDKAFCAGGDILALSASDSASYREEFYNREYEVGVLMAKGPRTQVALLRGHVLGSGVCVSVHGTYRVACETTRFAMPETVIGASPDVGASWRFSRMPMRDVGAYMAITGAALRGADVYHAGLATHYVPEAIMTELETQLVHVRSPDEAKALLDSCMRTHSEPLPPFTLSADAETLGAAFTITEDTTVLGIMQALRAAGTPFAQATLATMERNSPSGMVHALESFKAQSTLFGPEDVAKAFAMDRVMCRDSDVIHEFAVGAKALLVDRLPGRPPWKPGTVDEVDVEHIRKKVWDCARAIASGTTVPGSASP